MRNTFSYAPDDEFHRRGVDQLIADFETQFKQDEITQNTLRKALP
jgi:hypothetical protein